MSGYSEASTMTHETRAVATDCDRRDKTTKDDAVINVDVYRTCVFLHITLRGKLTTSLQMSRQDWARLAATPAPTD
jgi:hypothetical protein